MAGSSILLIPYLKEVKEVTLALVMLLERVAVTWPGIVYFAAISRTHVPASRRPETLDTRWHS